MMDILALDFDGVICDSAGEAGVAGWKAAARLWPHRFRGDAPFEIVEGFRRVRPVMKTGYESILLVRLLRDGYAVEKILAKSATLISRLMVDESLDREQLVTIFGSTRDAWIGADPQGWIDMHRFYRGVVDAVNQSDLPAYIITTKEKRFAAALCDTAGLHVPAARVFGLESGRKSKVLEALSQRHENARFHFVEDRLPTLKEMAAVAGYDLKLYFADWGYHTDDHRDQAGQISHIRVLSLDQFPHFARTPRDYAA